MLIEKEVPIDVFFDCLSEPRRIQILRWLSSSEVLSVTALCTLCGMKQQAISHHLTILKLRRLVRYIRSGKSNYYRLTEAGKKAMQLIEFAEAA
jgi:DNA-binding transcriptional ArsR family regulator